MTFWKCFHHIPNGNIWNLFKMFSFLYVIMMFPKWTNCDQDVLKTNQCDQNVPTNHMVKTFSGCYWGNFKWLLTVMGDQMWCTHWCYIPNVINVPIGSRSNTWSGYIWNIPNLIGGQVVGTFNQSLQCTQDVVIGFQAPLPPVPCVPVS